MNAKEILNDLVSYNTINDMQNNEIINYIEKYLERYNFKTEYKSNCIVMSNKNVCSLGFLGHTDTVTCSSDWIYNPFKLNEVSGNLYGLGTCDMKGAIAAILSAVSKIDFSKMRRGMKLIFTYDEEAGFSGIKELINNEIKFPDYMICGEPTDNEIIYSSKGLLEFRILFSGVSAHSSVPYNGVSAIDKCIKFINKLNEYYEKIKNDVVNSKYATMNIGVINGGRCINIVPDSCEVLIDFRTVCKEQNKVIVEKIKELVNYFDGVASIINNVIPFSNDRCDEKMVDYITEVSFIDSKNKCILGVGPINAHIKDEFITIDSLNRLEKQYIDIIKEKCK